MKLQLPKTKLQVLKTKSNLKYFCPVAGKLAQINKSKGCRHFNLNRDVHRYIFCFHLDCSSENLIIACPVRLQLSSFPTLSVHRYFFGFHLDFSSEFLIIAYLGFHLDCSSEYFLVIACNVRLLRISLRLLLWILPDRRPPFVLLYIVQRQSLPWVSVFLFIILITS